MDTTSTKQVRLRTTNPDPVIERALVRQQKRLNRARDAEQRCLSLRNAVIVSMHLDNGYPASRLCDVLNEAGCAISPDAIEKVLREAR